MALREGLTLAGTRIGILSVVSGSAEQPGIILSIALFIAVPLLANMITERKRVEDALRETEQRFRTLAETASDAIITIDATGKIIFVNKAAERVFGYSQSQMIGDELTNLMPEYLRSLHRASFARYQQTGTRHISWEAIELPGLHKNGEQIPLELSFGEFTQGDKHFFTGFARDITDRKRAEGELRKIQERLEHVVLCSPATIYVRRIEGNHLSIEWVSDSITALTGYSRHEVITSEWWADRIHPDDRKHSPASLPDLLADDRKVLQYRFRHSDGRYIWIHDELRLLRNQSGEPLEVIGSWMDITERREAERALRESEERYRDLVENAHDIIYSHDLKGNYTSVNRAVEQITGYKREEALKRNFAETVAPEYIETARRMIAAKLAGQKETVYDLEIIAKDGHRITVEVNTRLVLQDGVPIGVQGIARDVTARKRAEEALRRSEERFRRYFELGLIGMAISSPAKGFIEVNDKMCELLGYERQELLQLTWAEITHPEDLAANIANFERAMAGEIDSYSMDKRFFKKDGGAIHATISVTCVRHPDRSVDYFISLLEDVTERKLAEQALRESRAHLRAIVDNCPAIIFQKDLSGRYLQVNRQFERTFNLPTQRVLGRTDQEIFEPKLAAAFSNRDHRVIEAGRSLEFEEATAYNGHSQTFIVQEFPLRDANGDIYAVGGFSTDITARKSAEDDLRRQKEVLQRIFDHIPVMIRFRGEDGRIKLVNKEWERTLGWTLQDLQQRDMDILAAAYPDSDYRKQVMDFIEAATGEWSDFKTIVRDGRVIDTSWASVRLSDGTLVGFGRDITERKRADQLLRRQAAQLAALHEIELEISVESDLSRILEVVTRRAGELLEASDCSTFIRNRGEHVLTVVASVEPKFIGLQLKSGEGLAGTALETGEAQLVDDYSIWSGRAPAFEAAHFGPSLAAPLKWQQTVIGAISLSRKHGEDTFTEDDLHLLKQLAAEAAIAIHQAQQFDEIQESQRRLKVLSHRLIDAQEAERKRLARELHDQIGQALTAVQISLQSAQLPPAPNSQNLPAECLTIIDEALQQVHDLSLELRPSLLDDLGLVAALRWYVDRVATRAGVSRCFTADVRETRLASAVETACFRIAQEALTNVLRHAQATTIWVEVKYAESCLELVVQDDGVGFDVNGALGRAGVNVSLGLQGMQERAAALGGTVQIKSIPGRGAEVHASFPVT
jgi:PAS domain S-box-containing protein